MRKEKSEERKIEEKKIKVKEQLKEIINLINSDPSITYEDLALRLNISDSTIYLRISKLKELKILLRENGLKNGVWKINNNDSFKELMKG